VSIVKFVLKRDFTVLSQIDCRDDEDLTTDSSCNEVFCDGTRNECRVLQQASGQYCKCKEGTNRMGLSGTCRNDCKFLILQLTKFLDFQNGEYHRFSYVLRHLVKSLASQIRNNRLKLKNKSSFLFV
jgi:hypothetical protein